MNIDRRLGGFVPVGPVHRRLQRQRPPGALGDDARPDVADPDRARSLTPDEFAERLSDSFRVLWLIAVGITRDAVGAEDVVQYAAMVALGKLDDFDRSTNFTAWMSQTGR